MDREEKKYLVAPVLLSRDDIRAFILAIIVCFILVAGMLALGGKEDDTQIREKLIPVESKLASLEDKLKTLENKVDAIEFSSTKLRWQVENAEVSRGKVNLPEWK